MDIRKVTDTENPAMDTGATGDAMVFVKVREVYDLHTVRNKMTVIAIHTPKPDIIKANFPGLLMQCKAYRPYSCDVRVACASTLPLDPLGVGIDTGDVAPEDLFNPILYKACSNFGMSQIEARIQQFGTHESGVDVNGQSVAVDVDTLTEGVDEFPVYYGLLSNAHGWRTADPQSGLQMTDLKPLVYELLVNAGDINNPSASGSTDGQSLPGAVSAPNQAGTKVNYTKMYMPGSSKPLPFINCTSYTGNSGGNRSGAGFNPGNVALENTNVPYNSELDVPWINCVVGAIIVPPSRLHELFYRMVVEWTLEFSQIRPIGEITDWTGLGKIADLTHYQNYSFESTKEALGVEGEIMDNTQTMVDANVPVKKVM